MIRFVLHPGYVISINDWERHWIGPDRLCHLYHVKPTECLVWKADCGVVGYSRNFLAKLLHLYPLSGPDYRPVSERERLLYPLSQPDRAIDAVMGSLTFMERLMESAGLGIAPTIPPATPRRIQ